MPFVILPLTDVLAATWPCEGALPIPFAILELTNVFAAIWPCVGALPRTFAILELTDVLVAIWPCLGALPVPYVILPLTNITASIWIGVDASTLTLPTRRVWTPPFTTTSGINGGVDDTESGLRVCEDLCTDVGKVPSWLARGGVKDEFQCDVVREAGWVVYEG